MRNNERGEQLTMRQPTNLQRDPNDVLRGLLDKPAAPPKPAEKPRSAFISGRAIDASRPTVVRWSSILLILLSLLCTVVAFHGNDWQALRQPNMPRLLAAVALQAWCTGFQWYNRRNKFSLWYAQAFVLDVIPSTYAFGGIVGFFVGVLLPTPAALWLSALDLRLASGYTALVWLVAFLAAWQLARIPEDRLIQE